MGTEADRKEPLSLRWKIVGALLALALVGLATSVITYRTVTGYRAAAEEAVRKQLDLKEAEVRQQTDILAKAKADEAKARADLAKAKAESIRLLKEREGLIRGTQEAADARARVREEVAHVPESQVRPRIRLGLGRLRGGASGPGG